MHERLISTLLLECYDLHRVDSGVLFDIRETRRQWTSMDDINNSPKKLMYSGTPEVQKDDVACAKNAMNPVPPSVRVALSMFKSIKHYLIGLFKHDDKRRIKQLH